MNSNQFDELVRIARLGADCARAGNGLMPMHYTSVLNGWWYCSHFSGDKACSRAAHRASTWIQCAISYYDGLDYQITESDAQLMWGDDA
jgi:hypothetical protein